MTADEMRKSCLDNFDKAVARMRGVVADVELTNCEYRPLREALDDVHFAVNRILRVNGAIAECKQ